MNTRYIIRASLKSPHNLFFLKKDEKVKDFMDALKKLLYPQVVFQFVHIIGRYYKAFL